MCDYLEFIKNQGRAESADIIKAKDEELLMKDEVINQKDEVIDAAREDFLALCRHFNVSPEELKNILPDRTGFYV